MEKQKNYSLKEAAELLDVSVRSLYRYIKAKRIKAVKVGYWKISEKDLNNFIRRFSNIKRYE